jgi:hypothetical protein
MRELFTAKKWSRCILKIKLFFNLPMTLRIGYRREKKRSSIAHLSDPLDFGFMSEDYFNPFNLFCEPEREPASVLIPQNLPPYHHPDFEATTIIMYVWEHLKHQSFETFAKCIGHEMAHIVLWATKHPLKKSEIATDLTEMILGFSDVFRIGRNSMSQQFGYLNDHQFKLAFRTIRKKQGVGFFRRWFGI